LIDRAAGGDRAELLDAVVADADIPVVEVDGRVAMAGDQADLVAEPRARTPGVARDRGHWSSHGAGEPDHPASHKSRINYFDLFRLADVYPMWQHDINDVRDSVDVGFHL
jgi:hypothetical protein